MYRAIATNRHIAHLDPGHGVGCPFCPHEESQCPMPPNDSFVHPVSPLCWSAGAVGVLGFRFWEQFSLDLFIYGPKYLVRKKLVYSGVCSG